MITSASSLLRNIPSDLARSLTLPPAPAPAPDATANPVADLLVRHEPKKGNELQDFVDQNKAKLEKYFGQTTEFRADFEARVAKVMGLPKDTKISFTSIAGSLFDRDDASKLTGTITVPGCANGIFFTLPLGANDNQTWLLASGTSQSRGYAAFDKDTPVGLRDAFFKVLGRSEDSQIIRASKLAGDDKTYCLLIESRGEPKPIGYSVALITKDGDQYKTSMHPVMFCQDGLSIKPGGVVVTLDAKGKDGKPEYQVFQFSGVEKKVEAAAPKKLTLTSAPTADVDGSLTLEVKDLGTLKFLGTAERTAKFPLTLNGEKVKAVTPR